MKEDKTLIEAVLNCPLGYHSWREFEDACTELLTYILVPPLRPPRIQERTLSGIDIRDAIFTNWEFDTSANWGKLKQAYGADMVVVEYKNFDQEEIGAEEVDQLRNYLGSGLSKFGFLCCSKEPTKNAIKRAHEVFSSESKMILFITKANLEEMFYMKARNEDVSEFIIDMVDDFRIKHC